MVEGGHSELESLLIRYKKFIDSYGWSSYTIQSAKQLKPVLDYLRGASIKSMIDLGCGYKLVACLIAEYLGVDEVHGIDIDEDRLKSLAPCHVIAVKADITRPLDVLEMKKFDLITLFGVVEHIEDWDALFSNVNTLSREGSYLILSAPNLGSWVNRMALLLGFQPRDLEISSKRLHHVCRTTRVTFQRVT